MQRKVEIKPMLSYMVACAYLKILDICVPVYTYTQTYLTNICLLTDSYIIGMIYIFTYRFSGLYVVEFKRTVGGGDIFVVDAGDGEIPN